MKCSVAPGLGFATRSIAERICYISIKWQTIMDPWRQISWFSDVYLAIKIDPFPIRSSTTFFSYGFSLRPKYGVSLKFLARKNEVLVFQSNLPMILMKFQEKIFLRLFLRHTWTLHLHLPLYIYSKCYYISRKLFSWQLEKFYNM